MDERPTTRQEILTRLRHRPLTIAELAGDLGLTRTAILVPLLDLETRGLVRRVDVERTGRAGKPAQRFEIVAEQVERISPAYQAIAPHLLKALVNSGDDVARKAMGQIGKSIGAEVTAASGARTRIGLDAALAFLAQQGAEIEVQTQGPDVIVLSHSCPIGRLVRVDRCICSAIAAFLRDATGAKATDECSYGDKLTCRFRLQGAARP